MDFNKHSEIEGKHALLSPSQHAWVNYDFDKLYSKYYKQFVPVMGTSLHALAEHLNKHNIKLTKNDKHLVMYHLLESGIPRRAIDLDYIYPNLVNYVNDSIGYRMSPEQSLKYSENCFGTADGLSFRNGLLRIHDLKTGSVPADMTQLVIYAALFCLEYGIKPKDIATELRIYQSDEISVLNATRDDIEPIMETIVKSDEFLKKIKLEEQ